MNLRRPCQVNDEQPSSSTNSNQLAEVDKQSESVSEPGSDTEYDPHMSANEANMSDEEVKMSEDEALASEKPKRMFKCSHCNATFTRKKNRATHELTHIESEKKHKCTKCDKAFIYSSQLKRHMARHKTHTCDKCDFVTDLMSVMIKHKKTHSVKKLRECEKPQQCPHCDKILSTASSLRVHIKTVHAKSEFIEVNVCGMCGREYETKKALKEHYKTVHQGLTFPCPVCKKEFGTKRSLIRHLDNPNIKCTVKKDDELAKIERKKMDDLLPQFELKAGI